MKDKLIDVFLFLALIFGLIALVMGHVAMIDMRATASVASAAETEGAAQRDDVGIVPYGEASYRQVTQTPAANISGVYESEAAADQQVSFDEKGYTAIVSPQEINMIAYLVDKEIGSGTLIEKQAVVWCVLNRVDAGSARGFRGSVYGVLTQAGQFRSYYGTGSSESYNIVVDVLTLRMMERQGGYPIDGRVLPREFCWYHGDGRHNHFRNAYKGGTEWDWTWTGGY